MLGHLSTFLTYGVLKFLQQVEPGWPFFQKKSIYNKFILFVLLAKEKDPTLFERIENIKALGRDM